MLTQNMNCQYIWGKFIALSIQNNINVVPRCRCCNLFWCDINQHLFPDTDVLILAERSFPDFCTNYVFVTGTGQNKMTISLKELHKTLGPAKAAALSVFHAFTGADITSSFSGKGR